jgi:hypothetical protein
LLVIWQFVKKTFFRNAEADAALERNQAEVAAASSTQMGNGRKYIDVANEILHMLYTFTNLFGLITFVNFNLKNTDEKALGALLLTVSKAEFATLSAVYLQLKAAERMTDMDALIEDLRRTFNSSEQKQYLTHLT